MATVKDMLMCPKCNKRFLKKNATKYPGNSNLAVGRVFFCHSCYTYFGAWELVNIWKMDAGDLYGNKDVVNVPRIMSVPISFFSPKYYEVETGEPYWLSGKERNSAYQMVTRMFLDIPEYDDYADMLATQEDSLGRGLQ